MKLLVLGGTVFLGRRVVEAALAAGHDVTLFNRGRTNAELFPEVERIRGDRVRDLGLLASRSFDTVLDTSGYEPDVVGASARVLAPAVGRYAYVSSISAYADHGRRGLREEDALGELAPADVATATRETHYGELKALCERSVEATLPGRALIVRPGLIVGPHDPTGRFSYWPHRVAAGGKVLAPGDPERPVQVIDARDLAAWVVALLADGGTGTYNAVGPASPLSLGELLEACRRVAGAEARLVWVGDDVLVDAGVEPWTELPLWLPRALTEYAGMQEVDGSRALAAGLALRPLEQTIRAVLAEEGWARGTSLTRERESEVLARSRAGQ